MYVSQLYILIFSFCYKSPHDFCFWSRSRMTLVPALIFIYSPPAIRPKLHTHLPPLLTDTTNRNNTSKKKKTLLTRRITLEPKSQQWCM